MRDLRRPTFRLGLAGVLALLAGASCAGQQVREQTVVVRKLVDKARQSGAKRCAPKDFAAAEANLVFAETELDQGNAGRADEHVTVAKAAVDRAIEDSKDCGPTKVVIKKPVAPVLVTVARTDTDNDGILDGADKCPNEPEDLDKWQDEDGCPDLDNDADGLPDTQDRCPDQAGPKTNQGCPVLDKDADGIPDDVDRCPADPEDRDGFEDDDGCPDPDNDQDGIQDMQDSCPFDPGPASNQGCPVLDKDGDGILDDVDRCPDQPEDRDGFEDEDGCPDLDNDHDEVPDVADACPLEPGIPELKGCPPKDSDADGVPDHMDKCPLEEGVVKEEGCPPKYTLVVLKKEKIEIKEQVHFATNKHEILSDSFPLMDQVAQVLRDYPKIQVRIEGHTDSQADDDFNMKLSQRRADACRNYLVKAGISEERLTAVGFGETMPIASNTTDKGRAANRRVEFNIVER